jgi:hypothetical protein
MRIINFRGTHIDMDHVVAVYEANYDSVPAGREGIAVAMLLRDAPVFVRVPLPEYPADGRAPPAEDSTAADSARWWADKEQNRRQTLLDAHAEFIRLWKGEQT